MSVYLTTIQYGKRLGEIPIWMMRQAGRYLPEYRAIRRQHAFLDMVYTPEIACEVTLQPIRRFGFDAAILFSDILVIPQALGMELRFSDGVGPQFLSPIRGYDDVDNFVDNSRKLQPIYDAIRLIRRELPKETALIGFSGAPFTVASYMIEGGSSKDLKRTKQMMMGAPDLFHRILDVVTHATIDYLEQQALAGAQALQLFDTWVCHLDFQDAKTHSADPVRHMISTLRDRGISVPITVFGKHTSVFYPLYATTGVTVIGLDWSADLRRMNDALSSSIGIQGNLDPYALYAPASVIEEKVRRVCQSISKDRAFIFNLGHGLMPDSPIESVETVIQTIRSL